VAIIYGSWLRNYLETLCGNYPFDCISFHSVDLWICALTDGQYGISEPTVSRVSVEARVPNGGYFDLRGAYGEFKVLKASTDGAILH
jgi:hypothetical protein